MLIHIPQVATVRLDTRKTRLEAVLEPKKDLLAPTARKLFTLLFDTALHALEAKGQVLPVNQAVIHQPAEILSEALGVSRPTLYKHLHTLAALGLIAHRAHVGNWFGLARKTGTLFAVSLKPGHTARLRYVDLHHKHRDLQADTQREGRTAWAFLKNLQSLRDPEEACKSALKSWAVNPGETKRPVSNPYDCKGSLRETVYSLEMLSEAHYSERPKLVDSYAQALARGFLDSHNLNFWRKLLWDALNRDLAHGTLHQLQNALTRLMADVQEWQGLKAPGALLVARLKACGLWDALRYA